MINLDVPLAALSARLPWRQIEPAIAVKFELNNRTGKVLEEEAMFGPSELVVGGGRNNAGRSKLPIRLMCRPAIERHWTGNSPDVTVFTCVQRRDWLIDTSIG